MPVKERPILMHARSIAGILAGRKTQTRRIIKRRDGEHPIDFHDDMFWFLDGDVYSIPSYVNVGDRLWVRETYYIDDVRWIGQRLPHRRPQDIKQSDIYYRADGECCDQIPECQCATEGKPKWRPSIFMPRWASRLSLEITDIRVEWVHDISEADCKAEGCRPADPVTGREVLLDDSLGSYRLHFQSLWNDTNGDGAWERNDLVRVFTFKRVEQ